MTEGTPPVGWVGVGRKGRPMVHRLLDAAWRVCVLSRSLGADDEILRAGAEIRASPGEAAADARVVCLTLPDDASVRRVCEPLIPTLDAGQAIVDFGKTSPPLTQEMGKATSARGASFVYAPDSVWPQGARAGTLSIMVGATRAVARELVDLFAVLGSPTWFGATGKGQIAKLCNQIVVGYASAAITEAMLLGEAHEV